MVVRILKSHSLLSDFAKLAQRYHLEPTGISQNVSVPAHKLVEASHCLQEFLPRLVGQMVGIG